VGGRQGIHGGRGVGSRKRENMRKKGSPGKRTKGKKLQAIRIGGKKQKS